MSEAVKTVHILTGYSEGVGFTTGMYVTTLSLQTHTGTLQVKTVRNFTSSVKRNSAPV